MKYARWTWIAAGIVAIAIVIHVILPPFILSRVNAYLDDFSPVYGGHIDSIGLSFFRLAYQFRGAKLIFKKDKREFLNVKTVDVAISWRELFRARILTIVLFDEAQLTLSKPLIEGSKTPDAKPKEAATDVADTLFPIDLTRFELRRSDISFGELLDDPKSELWHVRNVEAKILNLTPTKKEPDTFYTSHGDMLDSANFKLAGKAKRLEDPMDWKADIEVHNFSLKNANPISMRTVPLSFTAGHLDAYSEVLSKKGVIHGYVKPFLRDVQIFSKKEKYQNFHHAIMELAASLGNALLREHSVVAAKIPFFIKNGNVEVDEGFALGTAFEHGFDQPLAPGLEESLPLQ